MLTTTVETESIQAKVVSDIKPEFKEKFRQYVCVRDSQYSFFVQQQQQEQKQWDQTQTPQLVTEMKP